MTLFEFDHGPIAVGTGSTHEELQRFDPISLGEMDGVALMNRVDCKYVLGEKTLPRLLSRICQDYRILEIDGIREFPYESLYFDTPDRSSYLDHHNGKTNRRKYRIREYCHSGQCYLEVKTKHKERTKKRRMLIDGVNERLAPEHEEFISQAAGTLPDLRSEIWTCFSRFTLVSRSRPERVTFDRQLSFRSGNKQAELPGLVIAEVKQESDHRTSPVREQLRDLRVRPLRVSKYCLGCMLLAPGVKYNRFKSKLLAIQKIV